MRDYEQLSSCLVFRCLRMRSLNAPIFDKRKSRLGREDGCEVSSLNGVKKRQTPGWRLRGRRGSREELGIIEASLSQALAKL